MTLFGTQFCRFAIVLGVALELFVGAARADAQRATAGLSDRDVCKAREHSGMPDSWYCNQWGTPEYFELSVRDFGMGGVSIVGTGDKSRQIRFFNNGLLSIFAWNEADDPSKTISNSSGMRAYWLIPVYSGVPEAAEDREFFYVTTATGVRVSISKLTGQITYTDRADFVTYKNIPKITAKCDRVGNPASCGGVELERVKFGLVVDLGWAKGRPAYVRSNSVSRIIDKHGASCEVKNSQLLDYSSGSTELRYPDPKEFARYITKLKQCKNLDVKDLLLPPNHSEAIANDDAGPATTPENGTAANPRDLRDEIDAISGADHRTEPSSGPVTSPSQVEDDVGPVNMPESSPAPEAPVVTPAPAPEAPVVTPAPAPEAPVVTPTPAPEAPVVTPTPAPEAPVVTPVPDAPAPEAPAPEAPAPEAPTPEAPAPEAPAPDAPAPTPDAPAPTPDAPAPEPELPLDTSSIETMWDAVPVP